MKKTYTLKADSTCWTVYETKQPGENAKSQEPYESAVSYHANLGQAAESLLDKVIRDKCEPMPGLTELPGLIREALEEVKAAVDTVAYKS